MQFSTKISDLMAKQEERKVLPSHLLSGNSCSAGILSAVWFLPTQYYEPLLLNKQQQVSISQKGFGKVKKIYLVRETQTIVSGVSAV